MVPCGLCWPTPPPLLNRRRPQTVAACTILGPRGRKRGSRIQQQQELWKVVAVPPEQRLLLLVRFRCDEAPIPPQNPITMRLWVHWVGPWITGCCNCFDPNWPPKWDGIRSATARITWRFRNWRYYSRSNSLTALQKCNDVPFKSYWIYFLLGCRAVMRSCSVDPFHSLPHA